MYDVLEIQEKIIEKPELIEIVLEKLGYNHINDRGRYYQFPNHGGDNLTACSILKSTLQYSNYSHGGSGNIFTLVMEEKNVSFPNALHLIASWTNLSIDKKKIHQTKLPFHGFFKNVYKCNSDNLKQAKIYNLNKLPPPDSLSNIWAKDGASLISQEKFGIRYSHTDDAVLIPIFDTENNLIGCKNRRMGGVDKANRFYAGLPYSKTNVVYGLHVNYKDIVQKKTVVIFESEKSVIQCDSFGFNYAVGISGHDISKEQARIIKSLMCEKIIVAFDEGICEEEIIWNCKKLQTNCNLLNNKIGYIYDRENKFLKKGSKDSPSDHGYKVFKEMIKTCVTWL